MNNETEIDGVIRTPLQQIDSGQGTVLHMLRCDDARFTRFGEVYFSEVPPGVTKAWKFHKLQTQNFVVPVGNLRVAIYDSRPLSPTFRNLACFEIGRPDHYYRLTIPPMLHYGFRCIGDSRALLANCADIPHDPHEAESITEDMLAVTFPADV